MTQHIEFTAEQPGERLDKIIAAYFGERLTRSQVHNLIHDGHVTVNGVAVKAGVKLKGGEQIAVDVPPPVEDSSVEPEEIPLHIVYEDDDLAVIDKPAGLVVHPGAGNLPTGLAVQGRRVRTQFQHLPCYYDEPPGIGPSFSDGAHHIHQRPRIRVI